MDHWVIDGFNEVKTVYEYFVEKFGNKFYTMEQMEVLAYIERYADKKSPYYYIDQIQRNMDQDEQDKLFGPKKKVEQTFYHKSGAKQSAYYRGIQELDIPGQEFGNFKNDFKKRINHVLKEITGGNFSLATCRKSFHEEHNNTFFISELELIFLLYLDYTYKKPDCQFFLRGEYHKVDEAYYDDLKFGIGILMERHPSDITQEDIDFRFDIVFGLMQREILRQYELLGGVVHEIANFNLNEPDAKKECQLCIKILETCEKNIMKQRKKIFPKPRETKK